MCALAFGAIALTAFRSGSEAWFGALYSAVVCLLLLSALGARIARERVSDFCFGFAVFGWSFVLLGFGLVPKGGGSPDYVEEDLSVNGYLLTTVLLKKLCICVSNYSGIDEVGRYGWTVGIGHLILTVLLAGLGGFLSVAFSTRESSNGKLGDKSAGNARNRRPLTRWVFGWTLTAILSAAVFSWFHTNRAAYFPSETFALGYADKYLSALYSQPLHSMNEPPFGALRKGDRRVEAYRILRLFRYDPPICVRVERRGLGAVLRYIVLDGSARRPGLVAVRREINLTSVEWNRVNDLIREADFWDSSGENGLVHMQDTENYLIEGLKAGNYHVINRIRDGPHRYSDLFRYLSGLTGFRIDRKDRIDEQGDAVNPYGLKGSSRLTEASTAWEQRAETVSGTYGTRIFIKPRSQGVCALPGAVP